MMQNAAGKYISIAVSFHSEIIIVLAMYQLNYSMLNLKTVLSELMQIMFVQDYALVHKHIGEAKQYR